MKRVICIAILATNILGWSAVALGYYTTDLDIHDSQKPATNASYMLIEPSTTWNPLDCPAEKRCI